MEYYIISLYGKTFPKSASQNPQHCICQPSFRFSCMRKKLDTSFLFMLLKTVDLAKLLIFFPL